MGVLIPSFIEWYYISYYMDIETKLWKRSQRSYATTIPHLALLNLDIENKKYKVIWQFDDKIGKWTVSFEETLLS